MLISCNCSIDPDWSNRVECYRIQRARKEHTCCECGDTIEPGKKYEYATLLTDDCRWEHYKTCTGCCRIRDHLCPDGYHFGELSSQVYECIGFDYRVDPADLDDEPEEGSAEAEYMTWVNPPAEHGDPLEIPGVIVNQGQLPPPENPFQKTEAELLRYETPAAVIEPPGISMDDLEPSDFQLPQGMDEEPLFYKLKEIRGVLDGWFSSDTAHPDCEYIVPSSGHCAAVSLIVRNILGGELVSGWNNKYHSLSHWYNWIPTSGGGHVYADITGDQFGRPTIQVSLYPLYYGTHFRDFLEVDKDTVRRAVLLASKAGLEDPLRFEFKRLQDLPLPGHNSSGDCIKALQFQVQLWTAYNFRGPEKPHRPLLGSMEELGELAHSHLKAEQGIRGTEEELEAKAKDAIGDLVIFLCDYCNQTKKSLHDVLKEVWAEVRQRDWIRFPKNGRTE